MADGSRIPRVAVEASALRSLPLSAADGFVLSRIDGKASERELASLTGLPDAQIRSSLDKLASLKVIDFGGAASPAPSPARRNTGAMAAPSTPPNSAGGPSEHSTPLGIPVPPRPASDPRIIDKTTAGADAGASSPNALLLAAIAGVPDNAPELAEEVDLPPELRRRILGLYSVVTSLDHYALLALGREADKKAVKRSYFELAALFHPDRYFRKNLGSFKSKMELIFAKVSTAYEALADKEQRAEYDLYLGDIEKSRDVESMLRNVMSEVESAERTALDLAASTPSFAPPAVPPAPESRPAVSAPPSSKQGSGSYSAVVPRSPSARPAATSATPPNATPAAPPPRAPSPVADQLRREALAMRLKGATRPVAKPAAEVPGTAQATVRPPQGDGGDALRRRYDERVEASRRHQGEKYVKIGEEAESRNDLTAASAAYRVALTFLREDDATYAHAREIVAKSELALSETYTRQADHEERAGRWEDAVRSWSRAAKLRQNDHRVQERYANSLVKTRGDLHEAARCAQKAIQLAPTVGEYHCTLASVHIAAGLLLNARRELESAALQFPENPSIQAFLKKLA